VRYLGVYISSARHFSSTISEVKKSFYRAFNAVFGRVRRVASELVFIKLTYICIWPISLIPVLNKAQMKSLIYVLESCFRPIKLFCIKVDRNC